MTLMGIFNVVIHALLLGKTWNVKIKYRSWCLSLSVTDADIWWSSCEWSEVKWGDLNSLIRGSLSTLSPVLSLIMRIISCRQIISAAFHQYLMLFINRTETTEFWNNYKTRLLRRDFLNMYCKYSISMQIFPYGSLISQNYFVQVLKVFLPHS